MTFGLVPFPAGPAAGGPGRLEHQPQPVPIRAVCLDIDDTMIDFTATSRQALCDLIGRDDMWTCWQRPTDEHVAKVVAGELSYERMHRERTKAFFADLGALLDDELVADLERRRSTRLREAWGLYDDTLPCLGWLRAAGGRRRAAGQAPAAPPGAARPPAPPRPAPTGAPRPEAPPAPRACTECGWTVRSPAVTTSTRMRACT